jgi:hypothetical protein
MTSLPANVVDLAAFRAERDHVRLPLFDGLPPVDAEPQTGVASAPAERLSERQVQHRARMLRYLTATRPARFSR